MADRSQLPPALRSEDFALPEWMEFGFQHLRVPEDYWKYFPERFRHRFAFADYVEQHKVGDHTLMHLAPLMRRYLVDIKVIGPNQRMRKGTKTAGRVNTTQRKYSHRDSDAYRRACLHFGDDFVEHFFLMRVPRTKQQWADAIRAMRAPHEFAQPAELGNIWPEALIAQIQLDYHFRSAVFEEHRMTPEKQAEQDYHNALNDTKWFNEHIDRLVEFLRNHIQRRAVRPIVVARRWATAPKEQSGLALHTKRYDHTLNQNISKHLGPRAWHLIQSFYDPKTRKHTLIHRDDLIKRLNDERPTPPTPPAHLTTGDNRPVVFDDFGEVIPVRWDEARQLWIDDFGDPVETDSET